MKPQHELQNRTVIENLADTYRQLYVAPGPGAKEKYLDIVEKGHEPEVRDLSHFITSDEDSLVYERHRQELLQSSHSAGGRVL